MHSRPTGADHAATDPNARTVRQTCVHVCLSDPVCIERFHARLSAARVRLQLYINAVLPLLRERV